MIGKALLVVALWPAVAGAQTIDGVLVDAQSGRVIPRASVVLFGEGDQPVDSARTSERGRFTLSGPGPGSYMISAVRDGYAGILSNSISLVEGETVSYRMEVPPLSMANMRQMSDVLQSNQRLGQGLSEVCAGRMNPIDGGVLLGVVRGGRERQPIAGAKAILHLASGPGVAPDSSLAAVTDGHGAYLLCFVPAGESVRVTVEAEGWRSSTQSVQVVRGTISWYDFDLRRAGGP